MTTSRKFLCLLSTLCLLLVGISMARADDAPGKKQDFPLGSGDLLKITVFQSPDLTTETRVQASGTITFPLIGEVPVGGLSTIEAEHAIAQRLRDGGFVRQPQVTVTVTQYRSVQVSVLGYVNHPGMFPIEGVPHRISDLIALAGGIASTGADTATLTTHRNSREERVEIDVPSLFGPAGATKDIEVSNGDIIYVPKAPAFYIYGEVQKAGQYRVERNMTVMQALAAGGGLTNRGTQRGIRIKRTGEDGKPREIDASLGDSVQADDVIYVRESLF